MNRLVLIGNGFDLAHSLKTRYEDFICWYWRNVVAYLLLKSKNVYEDTLCKVTNHKLDYYNLRDLYHSENEVLFNFINNNEDAFIINDSPFLERITKSIETKGWVDIENEYYKLLTEYSLKEEDSGKVDQLNAQLQQLQNKLVEYLSHIEIKEDLMRKDIRPKIYSPIKPQDISIGGQKALEDHINTGLALDEEDWNYKLSQYGSNCYTSGRVSDYKKKVEQSKELYKGEEPPIELLLPNSIMLLNFNYTRTAHLYCKDASIFSVNQIHGSLNNPKSVIFGYGDELDEDYKKLKNLNENDCLQHVKSIKYLEADNYRKVLEFIEAEPFQIFIMGHSCGNSDRTLLNTLFEHKNCVSIKPYYYLKDDGTDNYLELVQNISRNFTDMKLMRDRVVCKPYCEPLTK